MARRRKHSPFDIYHVTLKSNNQQLIFEEEYDYSQFLSVIRHYKNKYTFEVLAYCLMDNHIHLLLYGELETISIVMRCIQVKFVTWYNRKYQRKGHLFQNRFWSEPVDSQRYIRALHRYIHQNPCRAGICQWPVQYRWSSARDYEMGRSSTTDLEMMQSVFASDEALVRHMNNFSSDLRRYYYSNKQISDSVARELVCELTKIGSLAEFQKLDVKTRNEMICLISKRIKIPSRQLSRLTGVNERVIQNLRKSSGANG